MWCAPSSELHSENRGGEGDKGRGKVQREEDEEETEEEEQADEMEEGAGKWQDKGVGGVWDGEVGKEGKKGKGGGEVER